MESYKYLHNFLEMPIALIFLIFGVLSVLWGIIITLFKKSVKGIWFSGVGTFLTVFSIFIILGFNNTCFYPSYSDIQSSLTIENASASKYTLTYMNYIALLLPIIFGYIFIAWRAIDKYKITVKDISNEEDDDHIY